MFEFLFKYPASVFSRGTFVLLGTWPRWALYGAIVACALFLFGIMAAPAASNPAGIPSWTHYRHRPAPVGHAGGFASTALGTGGKRYGTESRSRMLSP